MKIGNVCLQVLQREGKLGLSAWKYNMCGIKLLHEFIFCLLFKRTFLTLGFFLFIADFITDLAVRYKRV